LLFGRATKLLDGVAISVEENIFEFEIAVQDFVLVEKFQSQNYLSRVKFGLLLGEKFVPGLSDMDEEFPAGVEWHYYVEFELGLERLFKIHQEWVFVLGNQEGRLPAIKYSSR